jgi:hypothetical protein
MSERVGSNGEQSKSDNNTRGAYFIRSIWWNEPAGRKWAVTTSRILQSGIYLTRLICISPMQTQAR